MALVVTQIPLDNPTISQELITSSTRPPWIRPARKKNPSGPRSTGSVESPLQDTSEFATSSVSTAPPNAPFNLTAGFSSVAQTQSPRRFSAKTASPTEQLHDSSRAGVGNLELLKPDSDTRSMPMPSAELMALVKDCGLDGLDVTGLFPQQSDPGFMADLQAGIPYGGCLVQGACLGSNGMAGIVGTP